MRVSFLIILAGLASLSVVAWRIQPGRDDSDRIQLTWVSDANPGRRQQIALFNELHPHLDLKLDPDNAGMEKVIVQSLAGKGPDLFDCNDAISLSAYVRSGIAWDVTDELEKAGVDVRNKVWRAVHPNIIHEGRVYGFTTNVAVNAIWFNKEIFDRYGVPYPDGPWKWEEFVRVARRLTVRNEKGRLEHYGFLLDWWNWRTFVMQWGGRIYTEDGTRCTVDSPEAIAAVQFMHDLIYRHRIAPTPVELDSMATRGGWGAGLISVFGAGKAAMAMGGRWWLCTLRGYEGLSLGAVEAPHGRYRVFVGYGRATLINKQSPYRDEALEFLKYMAGREYNELINHQADGIAPVIDYSYTDKYLRDPDYPEEDFNAVWRDSMKYTRPLEISPFVNGAVASRILDKQLDLLRNNQKSAEDAMRTAAREINEEIQETLKRDPYLREEYEELTGRKVK